MNKKVIGGSAVAVVVLVGGYLGATAYVGQRFHQGYEAQVAKLQAGMPFLQIVDRKVERSLFKATYSASIRVGCAADDKGAQPPLVVGLTDQVRFGPLPGFSRVAAAVVDSRIELPANAPADFKRYMDQLPPDAIRTVVGFGNDYRTAVRLPAGELTGDWGKAGWAAFEMNGSGRFDNDDSRFDATWPTFALDLAGNRRAQVKLAGVRMQVDSRGAGTSLWLRPGTSKVEVERLEVRAGSADSQIAGQLTGLRYGTEVRIAEDLLDGKLTLATDASLQVGRDAKAYKLDQIEVVESFKRLHVPTLQRFIAESMKTYPGCEPGSAGKTGQADAEKEEENEEAKAAAAEARAQQAIQGLTGLLAHNPEVAVERIAFSHEGRRGELSYSVGIKDFALKDGETLAAARPRLTEALTVKARTSLPVAWIEQLSTLAGEGPNAQTRAMQAEMLLDMALAKNYVVRSGDQLTSELLFERGNVVINGKPLQP
ncbi:conserved hypothetical protein [Burkholderiales bacterium 8X]|nr:conserved hypothetical protein [Burkholderiales bacterium 8X]